MLPSGSVDVLPSSETLSGGKVITRSDPATEIGGLFLLLFAHSSHECSFLEATNKIAAADKRNMVYLKLCFITKD